MGLSTKKPASTGSDSDTTNTNNNPKSEATTIVPSQNVSSADIEKITDSEKKATETFAPSTTSSTAQHVSIDETALTEGDALQLQADEDAVIYPSGVKLLLITLALCLSVFLVALDNTIIATAIPKITDHFNSLGDVGWYGSSYLLTTCALQLFFGK